jgi:hypothetical protein
MAAAGGEVIPDVAVSRPDEPLFVYDTRSFAAVQGREPEGDDDVVRGFQNEAETRVPANPGGQLLQLSLTPSMVDGLLNSDAGISVGDPSRGFRAPLNLEGADDLFAVLDSLLDSWEEVSTNSYDSNPKRRSTSHLSLLLEDAGFPMQRGDNSIIGSYDDPDASGDVGDVMDLAAAAGGRDDSGESMFAQPKRRWTAAGQARRPRVETIVPARDLYPRVASFGAVQKWSTGQYSAQRLNHWLGKVAQFPGNNDQTILHRAAAIAWLLSPCDKRAHWENLINQNVHVPLNIILWRLWIEHNTSAAVMMRGGYATGVTVFGSANFANASDSVSKILYGTYTFRAQAIVKDPKAIVIIDAVRPESYRGGNNCVFIDPEIPEHRVAHTIRATDRPSIIATLVGITHQPLPRIVSFTGQLPVTQAQQQFSRPDRQYHSFAYYSRVVYPEIFENSGGLQHGQDNFETRQARINITALQGHQFDYNPVSNRYDIVTECAGHRGRNGSGRGAAAVWNGQDKMLPVQNWNDYVLV